MTDAIVQWLLSAGEGKFLATVLISMLPVIELRGGLPAGMAMGLPLRDAFLAALLGNQPLGNALRCAWLAIGNVWMFGGLLVTMKKAQRA